MPRFLHKIECSAAAHCVHRKDEDELKPEDLKVYLGAHNISHQNERNRIEMEIETILVHEDWDPLETVCTHDIAILKLKSHVQFTKSILPICVENSKEVAEVKHGIVAGFGEFSASQGVTSNVPLKVELSILTLDECILKKRDNAFAFWNGSFCAGKNDSGVCPGDSGSGFYVKHEGKYYLRGLVSSQVNALSDDCTKNNYAFYSDILKYFKDFIEPVSRKMK